MWWLEKQECRLIQVLGSPLGGDPAFWRERFCKCGVPPHTVSPNLSYCSDSCQSTNKPDDLEHHFSIQALGGLDSDSGMYTYTRLVVQRPRTRIFAHWDFRPHFDFCNPVRSKDPVACADSLRRPNLSNQPTQSVGTVPLSNVPVN